MEKAYVERHDGGYWVRGTRVSLDSVVLTFLQGLSAETIAAECFPWRQANHGISRELSEKLAAARRQMLAASP